MVWGSVSKDPPQPRAATGGGATGQLPPLEAEMSFLASHLSHNLADSIYKLTQRLSYPKRFFTESILTMTFSNLTSLFAGVKLRLTLF